MAFIDLDKDEFLNKLFKSYSKINNEKLGIPDNGYIYHMIDENQNLNDEYIKTEEFIKWIINNNPTIFQSTANVNFINYGDTELVYVINESGNMRTLLIGQPNTKFGTVKIEYDNLTKLSNKNPSLVICPTNYFCNDSRESYLTPYIYQARCIASSKSGYGSYIPEPNYHFQKYFDDDCYIICKAIIANLILLYNSDEKLALASCKVGGGDFILEKEYDEESHTIENTLKRMHLIAARRLISLELDEYINLLKKEFSQKTYYNKIFEKNPSILINIKNRVPMTMDAIEDGIKLGLKLI